jgi:hypothetical protein
MSGILSGILRILCFLVVNEKSTRDKFLWVMGSGQNYLPLFITSPTFTYDNTVVIVKGYGV